MIVVWTWRRMVVWVVVVVGWVVEWIRVSCLVCSLVVVAVVWVEWAVWAVCEGWEAWEGWVEWVVDDPVVTVMHTDRVDINTELTTSPTERPCIHSVHTRTVSFSFVYTRADG